MSQTTITDTVTTEIAASGDITTVRTHRTKVEGPWLGLTAEGLRDFTDALHAQKAPDRVIVSPVIQGGVVMQLIAIWDERVDEPREVTP